MRWGGTLCALGVSLWASAASAEVPAEQHFSLEYVAAVGCPDRQAFIAALRQRAPNAVVDSAVTFGFRIDLQSRGTSTLASLPNGSTEREVRGESCADAAASMAVIIAMLLDRERERERERERAEPVVEAPTARAPEAPPPALSPPPRAVVLPRARAAPNELELALSAGLALESAVASDPPLGATLGVETTLRRPQWWSPSVRLELLATRTAELRTELGSAKLGLVGGRATGCVEPWELRPGLHVRPCVALLVGRYSATGGADALNGRTATMTWVSLGPALRTDVRIWRVLSLDGTLGLSWLTRHDRFVFGEDSLVYELPAVSLGVGLGLSWRFR